jgi:hypothetical protein
VCNRNRVPDGDCQDGLWGQVAVWPPSLVRVAWGARSASALSPLVAAGSHGLYGTRGGAASHLTVSCNTSPGCRPGMVPARAQTGEGPVHSSSRRPEVTGEAASGWALPCLPFGILSTPPVGPARGLNSRKATRTARPAWALSGTRPLTQRHCRWPALGREHGIAPQETHIMPVRRRADGGPANHELRADRRLLVPWAGPVLVAECDPISGSA